MLIDRFSRSIYYLRLSVTDRCNLRCVYCLPEAYSNFTPHPNALTDDEIVDLMETFAELGVSKVRITGGEPLVRPGLAALVSRLSAIPGLSDIALSTNAVLLAAQARALAKAGVRRVNISLDTLDPRKFREITRHGNLEDALAGLDAAIDAGLSPVKVNIVVARGMNDAEIGAFARLTGERPIHARFIELMPMGETGFFDEARRVPFDEMRAAAGPLEPIPYGDWPVGHGPARYYRRPGALGTVGFITALSCGFCGACNRMRLSASGTLIPCLDGSEGTDLRDALRAGSDRGEIRRLILQTVAEKKPERHFMTERAETAAANSRTMCQVGG